MAERVTVFEQKLKHDGIYSFKEVYALVYNWMVDEKYRVKEETYEEKIAGDKRELKIVWECQKEVSDYYRNIIKLEIRARIKDVEVEKDGKKEKMNEGTFEMKVGGILERDYQKTWEASPIVKFFRGLYDRYVMKTTQDEYEGRLNQKATSFVENVKSFLVLEGKRQ